MKIQHICETCNKELINLEEYNKCFNANHNLRIKGMCIVEGDFVNDYLFKKQKGSDVK